MQPKDTVVQRRGVTVRPDAILQDNAGHAEAVQPLGDVVTFVRHHQAAVATTGTDHHGRAVGLPGRGQMDRDGRLIGSLLPLGPRRTVRFEAAHEEFGLVGRLDL